MPIVREKQRIFSAEDAYRTWRVVSRHPQYTGETETFGFSNGQAVVPALARSVKCNGECTVEAIDPGCRFHERLAHLNNLMNYPAFSRVQDAQTGARRTEKHDGYRILSEDEYENEFGEGREAQEIDLGDF